MPIFKQAGFPDVRLLTVTINQPVTLHFITRHSKLTGEPIMLFLLREIDGKIIRPSCFPAESKNEKTEQCVRTLINSICKDHLWTSPEELKALKAVNILPLRAPKAALISSVVLIDLLRHFEMDIKALALEATLMCLQNEAHLLHRSVLGLKGAVAAANYKFKQPSNDAHTVKMLKRISPTYPPPWQPYFFTQSYHNKTNVPVLDFKTSIILAYLSNNPRHNASILTWISLIPANNQLLERFLQFQLTELIDKYNKMRQFHLRQQQESNPTTSPNSQITHSNTNTNNNLESPQQQQQQSHSTTTLASSLSSPPPTLSPVGSGKIDLDQLDPRDIFAQDKVIYQQGSFTANLSTFEAFKVQYDRVQQLNEWMTWSKKIEVGGEDGASGEDVAMMNSIDSMHRISTSPSHPSSDPNPQQQQYPPPPTSLDEFVPIDPPTLSGSIAWRRHVVTPNGLISSSIAAPPLITTPNAALICAQFGRSPSQPREMLRQSSGNVPPMGGNSRINDNNNNNNAIFATNPVTKSTHTNDQIDDTTSSLDDITMSSPLSTPHSSNQSTQEESPLDQNLPNTDTNTSPNNISVQTGVGKNNMLFKTVFCHTRQHTHIFIGYSARYSQLTPEPANITRSRPADEFAKRRLQSWIQTVESKMTHTTRTIPNGPIWSGRESHLSNHSTRTSSLEMNSLNNDPGIMQFNTNNNTLNNEITTTTTSAGSNDNLDQNYQNDQNGPSRQQSSQKLLPQLIPDLLTGELIPVSEGSLDENIDHIIHISIMHLIPCLLHNHVSDDIEAIKELRRLLPFDTATYIPFASQFSYSALQAPFNLSKQVEVGSRCLFIPYKPMTSSFFSFSFLPPLPFSGLRCRFDLFNDYPHHIIFNAKTRLYIPHALSIQLAGAPNNVGIATSLVSRIRRITQHPITNHNLTPNQQRLYVKTDIVPYDPNDDNDGIDDGVVGVAIPPRVTVGSTCLDLSAIVSVGMSPDGDGVVVTNSQGEILNHGTIRRNSNDNNTTTTPSNQSTSTTLTLPQNPTTTAMGSGYDKNNTSTTLVDPSLQEMTLVTPPLLSVQPSSIQSPPQTQSQKKSIVWDGSEFNQFIALTQSSLGTGLQNIANQIVPKATSKVITAPTGAAMAKPKAKRGRKPKAELAALEALAIAQANGTLDQLPNENDGPIVEHDNGDYCPSSQLLASMTPKIPLPTQSETTVSHGFNEATNVYNVSSFTEFAISHFASALSHFRTKLCIGCQSSCAPIQPKKTRNFPFVSNTLSPTAAQPEDGNEGLIGVDNFDVPQGVARFEIADNIDDCSCVCHMHFNESGHLVPIDPALVQKAAEEADVDDNMDMIDEGTSSAVTLAITPSNTPSNSISKTTTTSTDITTPSPSQSLSTSPNPTTQQATKSSACSTKPPPPPTTTAAASQQQHDSVITTSAKPRPAPPPPLFDTPPSFPQHDTNPKPTLTPEEHQLPTCPPPRSRTTPDEVQFLSLPGAVPFSLLAISSISYFHARVTPGRDLSVITSLDYATEMLSSSFAWVMSELKRPVTFSTTLIEFDQALQPTFFANNTPPDMALIGDIASYQFDDESIKYREEEDVDYLSLSYPTRPPLQPQQQQSIVQEEQTTTSTTPPKPPTNEDPGEGSRGIKSVNWQDSPAELDPDVHYFHPDNLRKQGDGFTAVLMNLCNMVGLNRERVLDDSQIGLYYPRYKITPEVEKMQNRAITRVFDLAIPNEDHNNNQDNIFSTTTNNNSCQNAVQQPDISVFQPPSMGDIDIVGMNNNDNTNPNLNHPQLPQEQPKLSEREEYYQLAQSLFPYDITLDNLAVWRSWLFHLENLSPLHRFRLLRHANCVYNVYPQKMRNTGLVKRATPQSTVEVVVSDGEGEQDDEQINVNGQVNADISTSSQPSAATKRRLSVTNTDSSPNSQTMHDELTNSTTTTKTSKKQRTKLTPTPTQQDLNLAKAGKGGKGGKGGKVDVNATPYNQYDHGPFPIVSFNQPHLLQEYDIAGAPDNDNEDELVSLGQVEVGARTTRSSVRAVKAKLNKNSVNNLNTNATPPTTTTTPQGEPQYTLPSQSFAASSVNLTAANPPWNDQNNNNMAYGYANGGKSGLQNQHDLQNQQNQHDQTTPSQPTFGQTNTNTEINHFIPTNQSSVLLQSPQRQFGQQQQQQHNPIASPSHIAIASTLPSDNNFPLFSPNSTNSSTPSITGSTTPPFPTNGSFFDSDLYQLPTPIPGINSLSRNASEILPLANQSPLYNAQLRLESRHNYSSVYDTGFMTQMDLFGFELPPSIISNNNNNNHNPQNNHNNHNNHHSNRNSSSHSTHNSSSTSSAGISTTMGISSLINNSFSSTPTLGSQPLHYNNSSSGTFNPFALPSNHFMNSNHNHNSFINKVSPVYNNTNGVGAGYGWLGTPLLAPLSSFEYTGNNNNSIHSTSAHHGQSSGLQQPIQRQHSQNAVGINVHALPFGHQTPK